MHWTPTGSVPMDHDDDYACIWTFMKRILWTAHMCSQKYCMSKDSGHMVLRPTAACKPIFCATVAPILYTLHTASDSIGDT